MGTGGNNKKNAWAKEAYSIAEYMNGCFRTDTFEFGNPDDKPCDELHQISPGTFSFKSHDKDWIITIKPRKI